MHVASTASPSLQVKSNDPLGSRVCASDSKDFNYLRKCSETSGSTASILSPLALTFETPDRLSSVDARNSGKNIFYVVFIINVFIV